MDAVTINKEINSLRLAINSNLNASLDWIMGKCTKTPQEPDWVAGLVLQFPKDLLVTLKKYFPTHRFAVTGIYCHQKPYVKFKVPPDEKQSELGDLLLLYVHTGLDGKSQYNSLLLQAKVGGVGANPVRVATKDQHQLYLYENWPEFEYITTKQKRDIYPKAIHNGAQYLIIDKKSIMNGSSYWNLRTAIPQSILAPNWSLANTIIDMLKLTAGRTFDAPGIVTKDGWTLMIRDLIQMLKDCNIRRANAGLHKEYSRIQPHETMYCISHFKDNFSQGRSLYESVAGNDMQEIESHSSVSIVILESAATTQEHDIVVESD